MAVSWKEPQNYRQQFRLYLGIASSLAMNGFLELCYLEQSWRSRKRRGGTEGKPKVIYPKYSKHWPYLLACTIDWDCSKILNHGFNHGFFILFLKLFDWKYILNWIENSGSKFRLLYCFLFYNYLDVKANLPETSPFFICPNGCVEQLSSNVYSTWVV